MKIWPKLHFKLTSRWIRKSNTLGFKISNAMNPFFDEPKRKQMF